MRFTVLISFLASSTLAFANSDSKETKDFSGEGVTNLVVKNGAGDVEIDPSTDGRIWVQAEKDHFPKGCVLEMNTKGSVFEVVVSGTPEEIGWFGFGKKNCETDLDIRVPQNVAVDVASGSGDVEVEGLLGSAKIQTGSGDVSMTYSQVVEQGEVNIKTGSGDAELKFPPTMKIQTLFKSGSGKVTKNELNDFQDAQFRVSMEAGSGDLEIKTIK